MGDVRVEFVKLLGTYAFSDWVSDVAVNKGWKNTATGSDVAGVLSGNFKDHYWGRPLEHQVQVAFGIASAEVLTKPAVQRWLQRSGRLAAGQAFTPTSRPWIFVAYNYAFIWAGIEYHIALDAFGNPAHEGRRMEVLWDETGANTKGTAWAFAEPGVGLAAGALVLRLSPAGRVTKAVGSAFETLAPPLFAYTTIKGFGWNDWRWRKGENPTGAVTTRDDPVAFDLPPESSEENNEALASANSSEWEVELESEPEPESVNYCEAPLNADYLLDEGVCTFALSD